MEVADKFVLQFLVDTKKAKKDIKAIPALLTTTAKKNNTVFNKTFKSVNKNTSQFFKTFNNGLKEVNTNFNILTKSFSNFNPLKSLSGKSLGSILGIGGAIGAGVIGGEELVRSFANEGARVKFLSQSLSSGTADLQIYEQALKRVGGTAEEADSALLGLRERLIKMRQGGDPEFAGYIGKYGLKVNRNTTALDLKKQILNKVSNVPKIEQENIANNLGLTLSELRLGQKSQGERQQLFNDVSQKGILTKDQAEEAVKMKNYFDDLFQSIKMVAYEVGQNLSPAFKLLASELIPIISFMGKFINLLSSLFELLKTGISSALENKQVKDVLKVVKDTKHAVEKQIGFRIVTNPIEEIEGLTHYAKRGVDYLKGKPNTAIKKTIKTEQTFNPNDFDSVPPIMQNGKLINQQDYEHGKRQLIQPRSLRDEHAQLLNNPINRPATPNTNTNIQIGSINLPNVTKPHDFTQESLKNALMVNGFNTGRLA